MDQVRLMGANILRCYSFHTVTQLLSTCAFGVNKMKIEYITILFAMVVSLSDFNHFFGKTAAKTTAHTNKKCLASDSD